MITIYFIYDKNAPESNDGNNADDTNASMDKSIAPPSKTSLDTTNRKNTTENTNNNDHPTMIMLIIASLDKTSRLRSHETPPTHKRNKPQ